MSEELGSDLKMLIEDVANYYPPPQLCTITRVYEGNKFADIKFSNGESLSYVKCIGNPVINNEGLLIFLNEEMKKFVVIC